MFCNKEKECVRAVGGRKNLTCIHHGEHELNQSCAKGDCTGCIIPGSFCVRERACLDDELPYEIVDILTPEEEAHAARRLSLFEERLKNAMQIIHKNKKYQS